MILEVINEAATAYKAILPADAWHEPYMKADDLQRDIEAGVDMYKVQALGKLAGVIGLQRVKDVYLIRHAYVRPFCQGMGLGGTLLKVVMALSTGRILVGAWTRATWAIDFYKAHGFVQLQPIAVVNALRTYWTVSDRQIELSTVLEFNPVSEGIQV